MKNIITDLKVQKRYGGRVSVYIDHRWAFTVDLIDAGGLATGMPLDHDRILWLHQKYEAHSAYACAGRFLSYRPRSRWEVERHLSRKGFAPETTAAILARLVKERCLDDDDFSRIFVDSRIRFRPRSKALLRQELLLKGIDSEIIDAVLVNVDDEEMALKFVEKKLKQWVQLDRSVVKMRLIGFLSQRGFSLETAYKTYRKACPPSNRGNGLLETKGEAGTGHSAHRRRS